jgi:hypothetical protein
VENLESPEFYTENYMEKIGIDMNHFILYLDDLIIRQKSFIKSNYDLYKRIKEVQVNKQKDPENLDVNIHVQKPPLADSNLSEPDSFSDLYFLLVMKSTLSRR